MKISIITPTHNPQWLAETWASIKQQDYPNWEWVVMCNGEEAAAIRTRVEQIVGDDKRVRVRTKHLVGGIGAIKAAAFDLANGGALVELDHDDLLAPGALKAIAGVLIDNPDIGFVYSDWIDFEDGAQGQGNPNTYMPEHRRKAWKVNGFQFYDRTMEGVRPGPYVVAQSFEPCAMGMWTILWAPNHIRAWRRSVYEKLGGHDRRFNVADDHELLVRTYLHTKMHRIPEPLYLYRYRKNSTWEPRAGQIGEKSRLVGNLNLKKLVMREAELRGLPIFDLGGGINPERGWIAVDKVIDHDPNLDYRPTYMPYDLNKVPWPWDDNSVLAFRAQDFLEHLPDPIQTMKEIWRCLVPGGWLLSSTPSTDGRGAFQDPTHVSFWNQNSWWYWCKEEQAKYIRNDLHRFAALHNYTHHPTDWHKKHDIPYVVANLIALKDGYQGPMPDPI